MRSRPAREAKNGWPMNSNASRSSGWARNTSSGTGLPVESSQATSKQNDLRRMSNECAVDLVLVREPSTRTVTSGSARHSVRTGSNDVLLDLYGRGHASTPARRWRTTVVPLPNRRPTGETRLGLQLRWS